MLARLSFILTAIIVIAAVVLAASAAPAHADLYEWKPGPPMPSARSAASAAALGGCIYVAGGIERQSATASFECLDVATRWQTS